MPSRQAWEERGAHFSKSKRSPNRLAWGGSGALHGGDDGQQSGGLPGGDKAAQLRNARLQGCSSAGPDGPAEQPRAMPTNLRAPPACCCRWRRLLLPNCWQELRASLARSPVTVSCMLLMQRCKRPPSWRCKEGVCAGREGAWLAGDCLRERGSTLRQSGAVRIAEQVVHQGGGALPAAATSTA